MSPVNGVGTSIPEVERGETIASKASNVSGMMDSDNGSETSPVSSQGSFFI